MRMMPRAAVLTKTPKAPPLVVVDVSRSEASIELGQPLVRRSQTGYERYLKPVLDRVGGILLLLVTSPLFLAAAVAIRRTMGTPVILRQERVGKSGVVFTIYKFRTMQADRRVGDVPDFGEERRLTPQTPERPAAHSGGEVLEEVEPG